MKVQRIMFSPMMLLKVTSGIFEVIRNAAPEDAKVVGMQIDPVSNCVALFIESATFDDVPTGASCPIFDAPVIQRWLDGGIEVYEEDGIMRSRRRIRKAEIV